MARSCAFAEFIDSRIIAVRVAGSSICVARFAVTEATELPESTSSLGRIDTGAMAFNGLSGSSLSDCRYLRIAPAHIPSTASLRSEEHTSELQSLMRISYAVFCLKKKTITINQSTHSEQQNTI